MAPPRFEIQNPVGALVFGSTALLLASLWLGSVVLFAARSTAVVGEVTHTYPCRLGRKSGTCGDVTYPREKGFTGTITGVQGTGPKGSPVDVLYDPGADDDARLNGPVKLWLLPVAVEAVGALLFAGGLQKLLRARARAAAGRKPARAA